MGISPIIIIAEAGVNHNGDINRALDMVAAAAEAGADYVKFQTYRTENLVHTNAPKAAYQAASSGAAESQYEMLKRLELSQEKHEALIEAAKENNIGFLSTAFDEDSADFLQQCGLDFFKVPSGEITNVPLLRRIGSFGRPVILSTGMANLGDIEAAIRWLCEGGLRRDEIVLLHCTSQYPADFPQVNLKAMQSLRDAFGLRVGYSDHTLGIEVAVAAVALGATFIEKHFTLNRNLPGPDHAASLEPVELRSMVKAIRNIELALGDGVKRPVPEEEGVARVARKGIYARLAVEPGQVFSTQNLITLRPAGPVGAEMWDQVVGRQADRAYAAGEPIQL